MKSSVLLGASVGCLLLLGLARAQETPANPATPATPAPPWNTVREQASYTIGLQIGNMLKSRGFNVDMTTFAKGISDSLSSAKPQLTPTQMQEAMTAFQQEAQAALVQKMKALGEKNKQEATLFLANNKSKDGVKALPSGLQYKVLKNGTGNSPKATDRVTTHYKGTLLDGTVFDSSYERNEPAQFEVGGVIDGWTEALQLMKVGDRWQLFVPAELAYGEQGAGDRIGPHAMLIFEVELLSIDSAQPALPIPNTQPK